MKYAQVFLLIMCVLSCFIFASCSSAETESLRSETESLKSENESLKEEISKMKKEVEKLEAKLQTESAMAPESTVSASDDIKDFEEQLLKEMEEIESTCPLQIISVSRTLNSIDSPEVSISAQNISNKTIDAYTANFYCYDNFNRPVTDILSDNNVCEGICQEIIVPGGYTPQYNWRLYPLVTTRKVIAVITEIHFTDNSTWEYPKKYHLLLKKRANQDIVNTPANN